MINTYNGNTSSELWDPSKKIHLMWSKSVLAKKLVWAVVEAVKSKIKRIRPVVEDDIYIQWLAKVIVEPEIYQISDTWLTKMEAMENNIGKRRKIIEKTVAYIISKLGWNKK
jgi:hypothetical protein